MIIRRKGSLASISIITKRIPDFETEESFTEGRVELHLNNLDMNIQYSESSESEENTVEKEEVKEKEKAMKD